jgi:hypothetical protein
VVGAGLLAGLLGLGRAPGGQAQLPRPVRWTLGAELGEPVAFGAQLPRGQPPHVGQIGGVGGEGLAAVTRQHPRKQLFRCPRLPGRMGPLLIRAEGFGPDGQEQVGAVFAAGELHVPALHVLDPVQRQQRPPLGAALGAHVGPRIGEIHPP